MIRIITPMNRVKPVKDFSSVKIFRIFSRTYDKKTNPTEKNKTNTISPGVKTKLRIRSPKNIINVKMTDVLIIKLNFAPNVNEVSLPGTSRSSIFSAFDSINVFTNAML